jgi:hypothetical protein
MTYTDEEIADVVAYGLCPACGGPRRPEMWTDADGVSHLDHVCDADEDILTSWHGGCDAMHWTTRDPTFPV